VANQRSFTRNVPVARPFAIPAEAAWKYTLEDPDETAAFARLVRSAVTKLTPRRVLDVGCGLGLPTLEAAYAGAPRVVGIDKVARNVFIARSSIRHARLEPIVTAHTARWEDVISGDFYPGEIDLLVANPPYVPSGDGSAVDGGSSGTRMLDSIIDALHLLPGELRGVALMFGSISDPLQVLARLQRNGFEVSALHGMSVYFGRYTSSPRTLAALKKLRAGGKAWFCDVRNDAPHAPHAYLTLGVIAERAPDGAHGALLRGEGMRRFTQLLASYQANAADALPELPLMQTL